ncbi:MAG: TVP38/TMEM64 family protein [Candidatus Binataceae bacterium]
MKDSYQPALGMATTPAHRTFVYGRIIIAAAIIAGLVIAGRHFGAAQALTHLLDDMRRLGAIAPLAYIGLYIIACVLFVPAFILTVGAGVLFGPLWGSIYVSIAATVGATCAFLIGRYLARAAIARRLEQFPRWAAIDEAVGEEGWKIVGLTRLSPLFPFNLLNYAYGLTRVSLRDYVIASWAGMLPATVMYVYIGSVGGDVARASSVAHSHTVQWWVLNGFGLAVAVAVALYAARIARRALKHQQAAENHRGHEKVDDHPAGSA